jgi:16S rRNA (cytidine1402-2'-O)-methyltransferase
VTIRVPRRFVFVQITVVSGTLFIVATPLGNLGDLSQRAAQVLHGVQVVAAEDTRRTRTLLEHIRARPRLYSVHAHSTEGRLDLVERLLEEGTDVAYVSDAGTPAVSDPGVELVRRARNVGAVVVPVPGPSAVTAALSASGLPADHYTFLGFPPRKGKVRTRLLAEVAGSSRTVVLFESANRLVRLLNDLIWVCGGERKAVVARELTKVHEEIKAGNLADLAVYYEEHPPRGEITLVVAAGPTVEREPDRGAVAERARALLSEGLSRRDVAGLIAEEFSMPRNEAYNMVVRL